MRISKRKRLFWLGFLAVFIFALLPRLYYPSSRNLLWYDRSIHFWDGLKNGNLEDTYQQYHPGVTTMWIAGAGMELFSVSQGLSLEQLPSSEESGPQGPSAQAAVIALGFIVATCIAIIYGLLNCLAGWRVALVAGLILALDPYYITHSKMIHVDALLASFMLISVLAWFLYLKNDRTLYLVLSGIFAGLAFLTKSPAGFLVPYIGLITLIHLYTKGKQFAPTDHRTKKYKFRFRLFLVSIVTWGLIGGVTMVLLWPAFLVAPRMVISNILDGLVLHANTPHPTPQFFAGEVTLKDPGSLFYPATVVWKSTSITLIGVLAGIGWLIRRLKFKQEIQYCLYLIIYIVGFILLMNLGAKKVGRYILPAMIALEVFAAWGLVELAQWIEKKKWYRSFSWVPATLVILILLIQFVIIFRHHPYFGTHFNLLMGGSRVAQKILPVGEQGEGADLAASFLNSLEYAPDTRVAVQDNNNLMFTSNFIGHTVDFSFPNPNYALFLILNNQRNPQDERLLSVWNNCQKEGPLWSKSFNGIPYAWVCPVLPQNPGEFSANQTLTAQVGKHIKLLDYDLNSTSISAGQQLSLTLSWSSDGLLPEDYHVFVHLTDANNQIMAQHDSVPVNGERATWSWRAGELILDTHTLEISENVANDSYKLSVGMYNFETLERLPLFDSAGDPLFDRQVTIADILVSSTSKQ